ncbi:DUF6474 family protein [Corynebacterium tapiri]|uniref:Uncharacterized protein n=1 Tax=Corynebacterium tapiri TaxID=1448266 RepID=A0A5C4U2X5_9CORY|nr:DUF6474 family protein [Corynebacterium tapiri]TNL94642.1 hypothetical protein FHE74_10195 [Corynebacterium tapiri]
MGVLGSINKTLAKNRQAIKAAQTQARQEVKASAKHLRRREELLTKLEKNLIKAEKKGLKNQRKHELKLAKTEYERRKAGKFNKDSVDRYIRAGRMAAPVLLPLIYRGITQLRDTTQEKRARRAGVTRDQLAQFSGHGAGLQARIQGIRNSLPESSVSPGLRRDLDEQLESLHRATNNAEFMTPDQRRRAHHAISVDIDRVTQEIQAELTRR